MKKLSTLSLAVALALGTAVAQAQAPATPAAPAAKPATVDAAMTGDVVTLTAKVESVDAATRTVVIKGPMGRTIGIKADERVKNFAQIKAGDTVVLKYAEAVAVALKKGEAGRSETVTTQAASAPAGAMPGAAATRTTTIVASVERVDAAKKQVLLQGPNGRYVEVKVKDPQVMKDVKAGDKVQLTYVEAILIEDVGPAKK